MSSQNDAKPENGELATDLISAIKEFEETTAKISSTYSQTNEQNYHMAQKTTESVLQHHPVEPQAEKGPIEYFNRTKETLRHVEQISHHNDRNNHSRIYQSTTEPTNDHLQYENDGNELEEDYVKIPVQQLINTFEKQMRSIIKQKINENIQLKLDADLSANGYKKPATNAPTMSTTAATATAPPPMMNTFRDNYHCDMAENGTGNGHVYENEMDKFIEYDAVYASSQKTADFSSMASQHQQQQTMTKQMECHEMAQSTIVESTTKRFSNSNETKVELNFDGGKAQAISTKSYPFCITIMCSLVSLTYVHNHIPCIWHTNY